MKRQSTKLILVALTILLIIVGCSPNVTQPSPPPVPTATQVSFPIGVFTKANWTMEINGDGSCHVYQQLVDDNCTYTATGDQVVFQSEHCKGVPGTYNWSYDGQVLSFTVITDKCTDIRNLLGHSEWKKTP